MLGVNKLTGDELLNIEVNEGIKLNQGEAKPMYIFGESVRNNTWGGKNNEVKFYLEIDTGSDRTLVSEKLAKRLKVEVKYFVKPKAIVGVGGKRILCEKYCIINFKVKCVNGNYVILQILAYVMENDVPPLLGSDVMANLRCSISYKYGILSYNDVKINLISDKTELNRLMNISDKTEPEYVSFTLRDEVSLRAGAVELVGVELTSDIPDRPHVLIGSRSDVCVVDLACKTKEQHYNAVVINFGKKPITLKRGAILGDVIMESDTTEIYDVFHYWRMRR